MMQREFTRAELSYVCHNLRAQSHDEIFGATELDPDQLVEVMYRRPSINFVGYYDGAPAAILGAYRMHGDTWGFFGFGTDDWGKIWRSVTKVALKELFPEVKRIGWQRAQCVCLASNAEVHKWLEFLGATKECVMRSYGKDGEDYAMFAWIRD